ncbi:MAG: hypothetical protein AAGN82_11375 [Myxococcota bacterium]
MGEIMRTYRRITPWLRTCLAGALSVTGLSSGASSGILPSVGMLVPVGGLAAASTVLVGCEDEQDPATWVKRLEDDKTRDAAVKRLLQFYEDAMTNDDKDRNGPNVKPLLELVVPPMTELAKQEKLSTKAQGDLLAFLADTRDPRVVPALVQAINNYRMDDKRPDKYDSQIADVVRNVGEMIKAGVISNDPEVNKAIFELFKKTHHSYPKARNQNFYLIVNKTLKLIKDPSYEAELIKMIEQPIKSKKKKFARAAQDQFYWQLTAAEVLGALESKKAVTPLLKMILTPFKAPAHNDALIALIRIGKPSLDAAVELMQSKNKDLIEYAKTEQLRALEDQDKRAKEAKAKNKQDEEAAKAYRKIAVMVVGNIGTLGAVDPMLAMLDTEDKGIKTTVATQLHLLPQEEKTVTRFKETYDAFSMSDKTPDGDYPKFAMLGVADAFMNRSLHDHILDSAFQQKGEKGDIQGGYLSIFEYGVKGARAEQWPTLDKLLADQPEIKVKKPADKFVIKDAKAKKEETVTAQQLVDKILALEINPGTLGRPEGKKDAKMKPLADLGVEAVNTALFRADYLRAGVVAKKVLDECKEDVGCYMTKIDSPEASKAETAMIGTKSIAMIGMYGGDEVKMQLVEKLPKVKSPVVRSMIGTILLAKSPKGDQAVAKKLHEMYDAANESRDADRIKRIAAFKQIIYRLEARAGL